MHMQDEKIHPIRYVAKQTGLSTHVIRAWEKRYGAVKPARTDTNRRLYSDFDVRRLQLLHQAVNAKHSIGLIAVFDIDKLQRLIADALVPVAFPKGNGHKNNGHVPIARELLNDSLTAVKRLDARELEETLDRALVSLTRTQLLEDLIVPLSHQIGEWWRDGELKIVNEHMSSTILRSFLGEILRSAEVAPESPKLLAATPSGQQHELGALTAALVATDAGWQATYVGPNLPAEEIALAAKTLQVKAIALSIVYQCDAKVIQRELERLQRFTANRIPLIIGGRAVATLYHHIKSVVDCCPANIPAFRAELEKISAQ